MAAKVTILPIEKENACRPLVERPTFEPEEIVNMEAPKLPSFIKQNRNKRFEYRPWFYDERKERLSKMKSEKIDAKSNEDERIVNLREHWSRNRRHGNKQSFVRLILITAFLFLLAYLLLFK